MRISMQILRIVDVGHEHAAKVAAQTLADGGIVLYPTDTLYGLGVDAHNLEALERLRELKGRDKKKPISVIVPHHDALAYYGQFTEDSFDLANRFLPGPLTLVVPANPHLPKELMLNGTIGLRIPDDHFCKALIEEMGRPFTATSANKSGHATPSTVDEVFAQLGPAIEQIALAIDDGPREGKQPSTVVAYIDGKPYVLREGGITRDALGF